jgi:hypothetical protein
LKHTNEYSPRTDGLVWIGWTKCWLMSDKSDRFYKDRYIDLCPNRPTKLVFVQDRMVDEKNLHNTWIFYTREDKIEVHPKIGILWSLFNCLRCVYKIISQFCHKNSLGYLASLHSFACRCLVDRIDNVPAFFIVIILFWLVYFFQFIHQK